LRLEEIDQIQDESKPSLLEDIAVAVRERCTDRHVQLATEDDRNGTDLHPRAEGLPKLYTAEWNVDFHHAAHVIATGEADGYYADYTEAPVAKLARALAEGYIYQGQPSVFRDGAEHGEPSAGLPPTAFIDFLQNHDQAGNRAFGERLASLARPAAIDALTAILLLGPHIPLLFMGEEWGETRPFCFFTDFHGELGWLVRDGRRNEFRRWRSFRDPENRERIPDPNALSTFEASKIDWSAAAQAPHCDRLERVGRLLEIRRRQIVPRLAGIKGNAGQILVADDCGFAVRWRLGDGHELMMAANLHDALWTVPALSPELSAAPGRLVYESGPGADAGLRAGTLSPWSVVVRVKDARVEPAS
jgi:malto-oligosyltrehalose trehalohydrolase